MTGMKRALILFACLLVLGCAPVPPQVVPFDVPPGPMSRPVDVSSARRLDITVLTWVCQPGTPDKDGITEVEFKKEPKTVSGGCVVAMVRGEWVYAVTANHCVPDSTPLGPPIIRVGGREIEVVERSVPHDLAVIRYRAAIGEVNKPCVFAAPVLGERIIGTAWLPWAFNIHNSRVSCHLNPGFVTLIEDGWIGITCPTRNGCSGNPLYNLAGEVVGIVSRRAAGCDSFGYAADGREAKMLLETVPPDK